ncbi:hypothetical protein ANCCAN_01551 [Ancylostoma caninum]|uniref:SCP domain-containing protein n=1 Tax=Ancylostoma caninum TaxID=29170 RepID=A0A368H690_ANCCA|nr:hypothetical protein ANCCAN_01551 [Ancylostoma caninum]
MAKNFAKKCAQTSSTSSTWTDYAPDIEDNYFFVPRRAITNMRKCRACGATYAEDNYSLISKRAASDNIEALDKAIKMWWQKVKTIRPYGSSVALRGYSRDESTRKFIKMAWAKTEEIGCAVNDCGSNYAVVCFYKPGGNMIGEPIYERGYPCSDCPGMCHPHEGLCLPLE